MATLVLTVVGGIFGGPVGAAVGAQIGNVIDRETLFKPKGREGPRLSDLRVQASSYGVQIPRLFGTMRVAGTVIWATELAEHRATQSGKGRPTTTSYSYSASFAVALSARPILGVGRIWADGKLLRGSAGDWKTRTGFRLHRGGEEQDPDPLIVAAEGASQTPAHRGIAYAVFEDLELGDFGNRIPSLTFEVTADAAPCAAGAIMAELGEGAITSAEATPLLGGFAATGASVRAAAETLAGASGGWFRADGDRLALLAGEGAGEAIVDAGAAAAHGRAARGSRAIAAAESAPRTLSLSHYDPARDWQIGVQRAARPGAGSREARFELPAAVDAATARAIAEAALVRADLERERRRVALGWDRLAIAPGARVTIAGAPGLWRVARWRLEAMVVTLECVPVSPAALPAAASGGRVLAAPDLIAGETIVHAFELPPLDETQAAAPRLAIAAAGSGEGWRSAALLLSTDGGASWASAGTTAAPAVLGAIVAPPGAGPASIEDRVATLDVELAHDAMLLADADAAALDAGANLAMAGEELIQFGSAEPIGARRWRLGRLWRGRRGTEAAIGTQAAGDGFVLIAADTLAVRELPPGAAHASVLAQGTGDGAGAGEAEAVVTGWSTAPPAPVHLTARIADDGATQLNWVRRSRTGWAWRDGVDAPLGEEAERYRVTITPDGGDARIEETGAPALTIAAGERTSALTIEVRQAGSHGLSPPATLALPAMGEEG